MLDRHDFALVDKGRIFFCAFCFSGPIGQPIIMAKNRSRQYGWAIAKRRSLAGAPSKAKGHQASLPALHLPPRARSDS